MPFVTACLLAVGSRITIPYTPMNRILILMVTLALLATACTKEKTDYQADTGTDIPNITEFKEVFTMQQDAYSIRMEALNGQLYTGYNEIRISISDAKTKQLIQASELTFLPISTTAAGLQASCPHRYSLVAQAAEPHYAGYAVFTQPSSSTQWKLYISFKVAEKQYSLERELLVETQTNKNLGFTNFVGKDEQAYVIALLAPQKPKVGEHALIAGIYQYQAPVLPPTAPFPDPTQFRFTEVQGYTLGLDPRMPEASMGNHSSPNNKDLVQQENGLYEGVVNYTMTGNWTLNFIMRNDKGRILKGTQVPTDFTPGVEGVKSDLYIDILF